MSLGPGYLGSFLLSLLWAISCVGLGSLIGRKFHAPRIESIAFSFLLGCITWVFIGLALASFHALKPPVILTLVFALGIGSLVLNSKSLFASLKAGLTFDPRVITLLLIFIVLAFYALFPVTGFDATTYHLPLASRILETGTISWTPHIFNSAFPQAYEILLAIGLAIGGDASASLVSVWFSLGAALALIAIGNRIGSHSIGLWAAIAISITPLWFELAHVPKNEVAVAFGILLLVLAIVGKHPGWIVGVVVGWLAGCKYYGFEIGILAFVIWFIQTRPGRRSALSAIGVAILVAGFWYARNIWLFANPIFPYFHEHFVQLGFPRAEIASEFAWDVYSQFDQFASPTTLSGWLTAPFRLLIDPSPNFVEGEGSSWKWIGWLAILWPLAIIPAIRRNRDLVGPYFLTLIAVFLWVTVHGIIYLRFLTPLLTLMYLLSFVTIAYILSSFRISKRTIAMTSLVGCVLAILHLAGPTTVESPFNLPLTRTERDLYLDSRMLGWSVISEINTIDPPPVVYYLYGENTRHYCRFPLYSGWRTPYGFTKFHEHASSGSELASWLEEVGVEILIVNHGRGSDVAHQVRDVLLDEDFNAVYVPRLLQYRYTSVFVHRDLTLDFEIDPETGELTISAGD